MVGIWTRENSSSAKSSNLSFRSRAVDHGATVAQKGEIGGAIAQGAFENQFKH